MEILPNRLLNYISDIIAPPQCELCSKLISKDLLCINCSKLLCKLTIFENENSCPICKQPTTTKNSNCSICCELFGANIWLQSLYYYKDKARDLVKSIKYGSRTRITKEIANRLTEIIYSLNFEIKLGSKPSIIAAPSHLESIVARGFNSTYYLTEAIRKRLAFENQNKMFGLTISTHDYAHTPKFRFKEGLRVFNFTNAKARNYIPFRNFIIIDDVITTGSTALGIAKLLKNNGANKILIVSIARSIYYPKLVKKLIINELLKQ